MRCCKILILISQILENFIHFQFYLGLVTHNLHQIFVEDHEINSENNTLIYKID
jgi:hypothetical protein